MSWGRFFSKILPKISQIAKNSLRIPLQFLPEKGPCRPAAFQTVPLNSPRKLSLSEKFSLIRDRSLPEKFSRKTFPGHGRLKFAIPNLTCFSELAFAFFGHLTDICDGLVGDTCDGRIPSFATVVYCSGNTFTFSRSRSPLPPLQPFIDYDRLNSITGSWYG